MAWPQTYSLDSGMTPLRSLRKLRSKWGRRYFCVTCGRATAGTTCDTSARRNNTTAQPYLVATEGLLLVKPTLGGRLIQRLVHVAIAAAQGRLLQHIVAQAKAVHQGSRVRPQLLQQLAHSGVNEQRQAPVHNASPLLPIVDLCEGKQGHQALQHRADGCILNMVHNFHKLPKESEGERARSPRDVTRER